MARNVFDDLRQTVERLSDQVERELGDSEEEDGGTQAWGGSMSVDVSETDDEIIVEADLPGFDPEDVDVRVRDDVLDISAEHTEESEEKPAEGAAEAAEEEEVGEERYLRRERRHRSVRRRVQLPVPVDEDAAEAEFENGVLTVTLPKVPAEKGTSIDIE